MEKRRDSKGRILRTGESQRKDGRYAYKYINALGEPKPQQENERIHHSVKRNRRYKKTSMTALTRLERK